MEAIQLDELNETQRQHGIIPEENVIAFSSNGRRRTGEKIKRIILFLLIIGVIMYFIYIVINNKTT
jgi:tetrahydromethanopterin S-methyltransferase subunit G